MPGRSHPADRADPSAVPHRSATPQRLDRVRQRRDFLAANAGVRVPMPAFVLLVRPAVHPAPRVGFTVSKKIGNAVARNRARRRLREAARQLVLRQGIAGADHVFIARASDREVTWDALLDQMTEALAKARRRLERGR